MAFLFAMRGGDGECLKLAAELAELVLADVGAELAREVLAAGPLALSHAVRLACHLLDRDAAATLARAGGRR